MGARLTPRQTVVKEALELLEFVGEPGHIPGGERKGGQRKLVACRPTRWEHPFFFGSVPALLQERIA